MKNKKYIPKILSTSNFPQIQYYPKFWAERPEPIEGESLSSWMIRTSIANLTNLSKLISELDYNPNYIDLDLHLKREIIQLFIDKTGVSEKKLREISLIDVKKSYEIIQRKSSLNILQQLWITSWYKNNKNSLRYCPLCLKEDKMPYFRKEWRLSYISFCPIHNCFLENECPVCNSGIAPYLLKWDSSLKNCYKCGADLTEIPINFIPKKDLILKATKVFLTNSKNKLVYKVLSLAWFIANNCQPSNTVFRNHPLTKFFKKKRKILLFSNIKIIFL